MREDKATEQQGGRLALLALTAFLMMLGLGVLFPVIGLFVRSLGYSEAQVGLLISSYAAMSFLFAPLWGRFSERYGRRPAIMIGLAGFSAGFAFFAVSHSFPEFLAARILGGIFAAATLPSIFAYVADVSAPDKRSVSMGLIGASIGMGVVMGPVFGGVLAKLYGFRAPFAGGAAIGLLTLVVVFLLLPESITDEIRTGIESRRAARLASGQTTTKVALELWPYLTFSFLFQASKMGFESTIAFLVADRFFIGASAAELEHVPLTVGYLLFGIGLVGVGIQGGGIRTLARRYSDYTLLKAGTLCTAIGIAALGFSTNWSILIPFSFVLALGYALAAPTFMALLSLAPAAHGIQAEVQGLNTGAQSLGRVVGPLLFLAIYAAGIEITYSLAALLCLLALALLILKIPEGQLSGDRQASSEESVAPVV